MRKKLNLAAFQAHAGPFIGSCMGENAVVIALVVAGIYALCFLLTYRIAGNYVVCHGSGK